MIYEYIIYLSEGPNGMWKPGDVEVREARTWTYVEEDPLFPYVRGTGRDFEDAKEEALEALKEQDEEVTVNATPLMEQLAVRYVDSGKLYPFPYERCFISDHFVGYLKGTKTVVTVRKLESVPLYVLDYYTDKKHTSKNTVSLSEVLVIMKALNQGNYGQKRTGDR